MSFVSPLVLRSTVIASGPRRAASASGVRSLSRVAGQSRPLAARWIGASVVGAGAVAVAGFSVWNDSPVLPVLILEAPVDPSTRLDPSTSIPFPISLSPPSLPASSPALSLVGLGVRTVSFLKVKVYSVGFYTAASARELEGLQGDEESMAKFLAGPTACALRIVPTRNTGFDHLRDGFVRSIQARFKLLSKQGLLSDDENERLSTSINSFKSIFSSAATATKGQVLTIVKLPNAGGLSVEFEGEVLGKVAGSEGNVLATQLMTGYFVDGSNANSPKMRDSVREALSRPGSPVSA